jgi:hypothetical protein
MEATVTTPDRFDRMLTDYQQLLRQLRGSPLIQPDCVLTAEAVWRYFQLGKLSSARRVMDGSKLAISSKTQRITVPGVRSLLLHAGHGSHGVVTAFKLNGGEHSMNVVNIRGTIYIVDAYHAQHPVLTTDLAGYLGYATRIEFASDWAVQIVPSGRMTMSR